MPATRNRAPEFTPGIEWFNTDAPVRLAEQLGRVVLLNFCAFSSLLCRQIQEDLSGLGVKYRNDLVLVGIHSPRYPGEASAVHLRQCIDRYHVAYPVAHDPELKLWRLHAIKRQPTQVLIDRSGYVAGTFSGAWQPERLDQVIRYQCDREGEIPRRAVTPLRTRRPHGEPRALSFPGRIAVSDSRIFIADSGHNRILVTTHGGTILCQYGSESAGFIDGNGELAAFNNPQGMVLEDDFLYVADAGNHAIRRIHTRTDDVDTVAGDGKAAAGGSGLHPEPLACRLNAPHDLVMKDGMLYIAMTGANQIWRLSLLSNTIGVFSGTGEAGLVDGAPSRAMFAQPVGLGLIGQTLYVVDADAGAVRAVDTATGGVTTLVGRQLYGFGNRDGSGRAALLQYPQDIEADPQHKTLWVADSYNNKIRKIRLDSQLVSSPVIDCGLNEPGGLAFHNDTLYIANTHAHEILRMNPNDGHTTRLNVAEEIIEI